MKKWASFAAFLLILSTGAICQEKDLTINAQNLNYSEDGRYVEAVGSVEVLYKDLKATGDKYTYFTSERQLYTDSGFNLSYQGMDFFGRELNFNIRSRDGIAREVNLKYKNVVLSGKSVNMEKDRIELADASFTTCDLSTTHYHFNAQKIIFYPEDGWLICYWGVFWLDGAPTMPVPIYIYDLKADEKGFAQSIPYPQFGSNDWDGRYISQSFAWHASRALNGNFYLSYAERKGAGSGLDLKYSPDDRNGVFFKVYSKARDPMLGILEYSHNFGRQIKRDDLFSFQVFKVPGFRQNQLNTRISLNEIVNYEKVSMLPMINLKLRKGSLGSLNFSGSVSGGYVTEESTGSSLWLANEKFEVSSPVWEGFIGQLTPRLANDYTYYSNSSRWLKATAGFDLSKTWSEFLSTTVGYNHFLMNSGTSPFNYELYRFIAQNQVNAGFLAGWDSSKFGISAVYNLPDYTPQEFDYIIRAGIHCFNVLATYRAMRRELSFGFGIN